MENERWVGYLTPLPDRFRDDSLRELRASARRARAAYGPKDSIRDALPEAATEPLLLAIDRLLKAIARFDMNRCRPGARASAGVRERPPVPASHRSRPCWTGHRAGATR